ncbi:hypothetical protein HYN51_14740 [Limnobaculum parvum]|uniref:Uncharacterized protein n=1 Tax=Limnobaculum parvum TaxID=2172103 RepID=A0A2Y9U257_9GAMM|nr:hypothetical protein HYN51_14740 [Limnobaculum parvum]
MQYKKPENFTHFGAKSNLKRLILVIQFQKWLEQRLYHSINGSNLPHKSITHVGIKHFDMV